MKFAERLYRHLLGALPGDFRKEYEEAVVQLFRDLCRDAVERRGTAGLVAVWGFLLKDLAGCLIREHRAEGRKAMNRWCEATAQKLVTANSLASSMLSVLAQVVLIGGVFKLTSLPLTEGQLMIGLLCTLAVSLQLVILAVLTAPPKVVPVKE